MSAFHQEVVGTGGESIVTLDLQSSVIKESDLQSEAFVMMRIANPQDELRRIANPA